MLAKISKKLKTISILIWLFVKIESLVRKRNSCSITLHKSFLSKICICAHDIYVSNTETFEENNEIYTC